MNFNLASYTTAGGSVFLGLQADTWGIVGVVVGIVIAVLTYGTNVYFKCQILKRKQK